MLSSNSFFIDLEFSLNLFEIDFINTNTSLLSHELLYHWDIQDLGMLRQIFIFIFSLPILLQFIFGKKPRSKTKENFSLIHSLTALSITWHLLLYNVHEYGTPCINYCVFIVLFSFKLVKGKDDKITFTTY